MLLTLPGGSKAEKVKVQVVDGTDGRSVLYSPKDSQVARSAVGLHSRVSLQFLIYSMENRMGTRP